MRKKTLCAVLTACVAACATSGEPEEEANVQPAVFTPQPEAKPTGMTPPPMHTTPRPASNAVFGPKVEVIPYDPDAELMPEPIKGNLDVIPYDPDAYRPGPFAGLNDNVKPALQGGTETAATPPNGQTPQLFPDMPPDEPMKERAMGDALLDAIERIESEQAKEGGKTIENAKALLALYLASDVSANATYADRASQCVNFLRESTDFADKEWLRLQEAELNRQVNEHGACARDLKAAYVSALKLVPMDAGSLYFSDGGSADPQTGVYGRRMTKQPNGEMVENTVVNPGDIFYIAFPFRYLNYSAKTDTGSYTYKLKIVSEFADLDGNPVNGFKGDLWLNEFTIEKEPDEYISGRQKYALPYDIVIGDYKLKLTFYDLNRPEPEKHPLERTIDVHVR